jgi:dynein heavy chain 1, cytosolic
VNFNSEKEEENSSFSFVNTGMRLELKSENNLFFLDPPLEHAKFVWTQEFHKVIGLLCCLPRLESNKY